MLSDKNTLLVKHTFINLTSCENTVPNFVDCKNTASVSQLSSPKSIRNDSPSYSCASKSKSSFGSCSSFLTCDDSNEDATEEMYYSCDSVFSLDWNSPNKCSIKESVSVVPNNTDLSSHSHSAHSFLSESKETSVSENCDKLLGAEYKSSFLSDSKETSVSENCDKLLGAECKSSLLSDSSTAIESAQYEDFSNDCDITDSKYEKSEKYLKLKDVPIFKRHKKKATAKSTYKYSCNKCLNSVIVKKAFVSLITGSSLILNLKIKTHNVFLGYPVHLLPDDVKHKIKLNSVVKIMFIQENILSLSHVLALQLDTT
ncbi:uncharacterized protein LOC129221240 [Uloborus diversus]|uniref:uncharacterized protein LOC129221240 n=1 Tax=Uloborus diversus TaxID=327109 RepID=UPI002409F303|nr:uncharacterized protein LOC129221240 [Uloborus diversus]